MTIRTGPAGADGIGYLPALQKAAKLGLGCLEATLVCEPPRPYPDAAMMRRVLDGLRARLPAPKGPLVKRSVRTST